MRALARTLGNYLYLRDEEPPFGTSDAIALGLLLADARKQDAGAQSFYEGAFGSLCRALALDGTALLDGLDWTRFDERPGVPLRQLARLRSSMTSFCDEWGPVMEGDIWGTRLPDALSREAIKAARDWYEHQRAGPVLDGVVAIDRALVRLLGWDAAQTVPLDLLRKQHQFPDSDLLLP